MKYGYSLGWHREDRRDHIAEEYGLSPQQRDQMDETWITLSRQHFVNFVSIAAQEKELDVASLGDNALPAPVDQGVVRSTDDVALVLGNIQHLFSK